MTTTRLKGVLAPVITPFHQDLSIDPARLIAHGRWLLSQNAGLALFGTNSEANSLSVEERIALLQAVVDAGLPPARMMPGTGCCSLPDTIKLTKHAVSVGCAGVLMLPPFYYKGVSDDGLFRHFAEVVERVGDARLRIYLYHIPPVAQVPITLPLLERLAKAYPQNIVGMKDSSGDWNYTQSILGNFPQLDMFVGSEAFLLAGMRGGGVGCISATANVNPAAIHDLYAHWQSADADERQAGLTATRMAIQAFPMIPALKATRARYAKDPAWVTVRPPLVALTAKQQDELGAALDARRFAMPGLGA